MRGGWMEKLYFRQFSLSLDSEQNFKNSIFTGKNISPIHIENIIFCEAKI